MKKRQQKKSKKGIIILLLLLLGAGIFIFYDKIFPTQNEGLAIQVEVMTESGQTEYLSVAKTFATVGGVSKVIAIKLHPIAKNIGEVNITNVRIISSSPQQFTNSLPAVTTNLAVGASFDFANPNSSAGWMDANALIGGDVTFTATIEFTSFDAQGNPMVQTRTAVLVLNIVGDACSDGTPDLQCSVTKPKKCVGGVLVDAATTCGCPEGYEQVNETCIASSCSDGTLVGRCTTQKPAYCGFDKLIVNDCVKCGCPLDYYGNPATCDTTILNCTYRSYVSDISVSITGGTSAAVKFRTSNTNYPTNGAAVAYALNGCGNTLTAYGAASSTTTTTLCTTAGYTIVATTPQGYKVCTRAGYPSNIYVQLASNAITYTTSDSDASMVETTPVSINSVREVTC